MFFDMHNHDHNHTAMELLHEGNNRGLGMALFITFSIMLLEFFGGLFTGSLALLADSGHMLSDVGSLGLSLLAFWLAARPASETKSFGFHRFEILAALLNGTTLFAMAGLIIWEAYHRFLTPMQVDSAYMMIIATVGLLANVLSAFFLHQHGDVKDNINLKSAYLHVLSDALGSVGAIVAGALMLLFQWYIADPIISVIVALLILRSAWGITGSAIHILIEGTPDGVKHEEVIKALESIDGVINVHDLHIWKYNRCCFWLDYPLLFMFDYSYIGGTIKWWYPVWC